MNGKKVATFTERFNELIESSPKSRTAIAQEFGVAKQTISAWLTGQNSPRLPVVAALAEYFGVSLRWLNGFDVPKYDPPDHSKDPDPPEPDLKTPEARLLAIGVDKMPAEQRQAIMNIMVGLYPNIFQKGNTNDDT